MGAAIAWPRSGGNIKHNERSVKIDLWVFPLNERSGGLGQPYQTIKISIVESNCKAPFSLSRFKVPVHPGLMIRDEP